MPAVLTVLAHAAVLLLAYLLTPRRRRAPPRKRRNADDEGTVAFLHPSCDGGGGGERVFYAALSRALEQRKKVIVFAATTDEMFDAKKLVHASWNSFGIPTPSDADVTMVNAKGACRSWIAPETYPVATMIGQALGFARLAYELLVVRSRVVITSTACDGGDANVALNAWHARDSRLLVDTAGNAFACAAARALLPGCRTISYTHYPLVNSDMEAAVRDGDTSALHNRGGAGRGTWRTKLKLGYYRALARVYGEALRSTARGGGCVVCNSSWTLGHIERLMRQPVGARVHAPRVVFPPCSLAPLLDLPLTRGAHKPLVYLCVAQFRPEKNQRLLLDAFRDADLANARLVFVGGARNAADRERAEALREAAGGDPRVEVIVGASHGALTKHLADAHFGLHAMRLEHFGICVCEYMAAGCVAIAHDSGGPRADILNAPGLGYLASDRAGYAAAISAAAALPNTERLAMAARAREHVKRHFGDAQFASAWSEVVM